MSDAMKKALTMQLATQLDSFCKQNQFLANQAAAWRDQAQVLAAHMVAQMDPRSGTAHLDGFLSVDAAPQLHSSQPHHNHNNHSVQQAPTPVSPAPATTSALVPAGPVPSSCPHRRSTMAQHHHNPHCLLSFHYRSFFFRWHLSAPATTSTQHRHQLSQAQPLPSAVANISAARAVAQPITTSRELIFTAASYFIFLSAHLQQIHRPGMVKLFAQEWCANYLLI